MSGRQEALLENWEGDAEKALPGSIIQYDIHRGNDHVAALITANRILFGADATIQCLTGCSVEADLAAAVHCSGGSP